MNTFRKEKIFDLMTPPKGIEGVYKVCVLHFFPFNLICYMTTFRKKCFFLLTPSRGIKGQNVSLHCVLCFIPVNLICKITIFRKEKYLTFWSRPRFEGVCKFKIFASVLLYASLPWFDIQHMTVFWKSWFLASDKPLRSTQGFLEPAFQSKICFISILPLSACKISLKILTTFLATGSLNI